MTLREQLYKNYGAYSKKYFEILSKMSEKDNFTLSEIAKETNYAFKMITELVNFFSNDIQASNQGLYNVKSELKQEIDFLKNYFAGLENIDREQAKAKYLQYASKFTSDKKDLDHISATAETAINRAMYLIENYDVEKLNIAFLGDHDFTSIALNILIDFKTTVFDIDNDILNHISNFNENIMTFYADFRFGINKIFNDKFDLVFTDPPYTTNGMDCFLTNAKILCKKSLYSVILCSYYCGDLSIKNGLNVQRMILDSGLYIEEILHKFNKYNFAESLGYTADLYVLRLTNFAYTKNSLKLNNEINIYTHGFMSNESMYQMEQYANMPMIVRVDDGKSFNIFTLIKSSLNGDNFALPKECYLQNFADYKINFVQFLFNMNFKTLYFKSKEQLNEIVAYASLTKIVNVEQNENIYKISLLNNLYAELIKRHNLMLNKFINFVQNKLEITDIPFDDYCKNIFYKYKNYPLSVIPYKFLFKILDCLTKNEK